MVVPGNRTRRRELSGDAAIVRAPELLDEAMLLAADPEPIVFACRELARMDTAGLQVLLALRVAVSQAGGSVHLTDVPDPVVASLRLAGLTDLVLDAEGEQASMSAPSTPTQTEEM